MLPLYARRVTLVSVTSVASVVLQTTVSCISSVAVLQWRHTIRSDYIVVLCPFARPVYSMPATYMRKTFVLRPCMYVRNMITFATLQVRCSSNNTLQRHSRSKGYRNKQSTHAECSMTLVFCDHLCYGTEGACCLLMCCIRGMLFFTC